MVIETLGSFPKLLSTHFYFISINQKWHLEDNILTILQTQCVLLIS